MKNLLLLIVLVTIGSLTTLQLPAQGWNCPSDTIVDVERVYPLLVQLGITEYDYTPVSLPLSEDTLSVLLGSIRAKYVSTRLLWKCNGDDLSSSPPGIENVIGCVERTFSNKKNKPVYIQTAWLKNTSPFTEKSITWPEDLTLYINNGQYEYALSNELDIGFDKFQSISIPLFGLSAEDLKDLGIDPLFIFPTAEEGPYSLIGMTYDDEIVGGPRNPHHILRTWSVIDWCLYSQAYDIWYHTQTISFVDTVTSSTDALFSDKHIIWPEDIISSIRDTADLVSQLDPERLGWQNLHGTTIYNGYPEIAFFAKSSVGINYTDTIVAREEREEYDEVYVTYFEVHRTWSVIDWDHYDRASGAGLWKQKQVLRLAYVQRKE